MKYDYIFLLGRETELSLAELKSVFADVHSFGNFALVTEEEETLMDMTSAIGGTIKIGKILSHTIQKQNLLEKITFLAREKVEHGKKLRIGIDSFVPAFSSLVFKLKDALKSEGASIRVVQHEGGRIKTATTLHEKLVTQGYEMMIIPTPEKNGYILAETVFVQDIDAYSKRDMERERSMVVGMMPPKIAQIMINLATKGDRGIQIYDSFCGLGTTIIEAFHGGYTQLLASDISPDMVKTTTGNAEKIGAKCDVFHLDARKIDEKNIEGKTAIVTEGMLGKIFTTSSINHNQVLLERKELTNLYADFLASSWKNVSIDSIVFCFPFWNIGRESIFMPDIAEITSNWTVDEICRSRKRFLQHMRPAQSVGREIIVLRRKRT